MPSKKYPKSESDAKNSKQSEPAYVSWEGSKQDRENGLGAYNDAVHEFSTASYSARTRNFSDLTTYLSGKPGLRNSDYDFFRPEQAVPEKPKDIIAFARTAYRRIGLIRNAIDLMGDFACQGVRLVHKNKRVERFYNSWFDRVNGNEVSERLCNLLFREANVPITMKTAKVNRKKREEMQRSIASPDLVMNLNDTNFLKNEIPWEYTFVDPLTVEVIGGPVAGMIGEREYVMKLPKKIVNMIRKLRNSADPLHAYLKKSFKRRKQIVECVCPATRRSFTSTRRTIGRSGQTP